MPDSSYDCIIAGGGPAGALCAATLASWGRSVLLVQEGSEAAKLPAETLVPTALPRFERLGLGAILRREEFEGTARQGSVWGTPEIRWRELDLGGRGFRIDRATFDLALRNHAAACGAKVLEGWRVLDPFAESDAWCLRGPDGIEQDPSARVRIAACGRPLDGARLPSVNANELVQTCALWSRVENTEELRDATMVEAVPQGWLWSLPLHDGSHCVTLFGDLEEVKERGRDELFADAIRCALGAARGSRPGRIRGTLCTPTLRRFGEDVLLAGDAASSIDPLSSQGVEKALASAEDCAYAANTWIESPDLASEIQAYRSRWERRLFEAHSRDTLRFYAREQRFNEAMFWRKRHEAERLMGRGQTGLRPGPEVESKRLAVRGDLQLTTDLIRRDRRLVSCVAFQKPDSAEIHHRIGRVDLASLFELMPGDINTILTRARSHPRLVGLTPQHIREALAVLLQLEFIAAMNDREVDEASSR